MTDVNVFSGKPLGLANVFTAFVVSLFGLITSFVLLIIEMITVRYGPRGCKMVMNAYNYRITVRKGNPSEISTIHDIE